MITLYGYTQSSNVQLVAWGLAELGLGFRLVERGLHFGGLDTPGFRAMNPHGLVPVIDDDGLIPWESCAILRHLASRYGTAPFWPGDPAERARIDMWAEWGKVKLRIDFTPVFRARVRTVAKDRDAVAMAAAMARFDADLAILEAQIGGGPWVMGKDFTVADMLCSIQLFRYFTIDIARSDRPGIAAYYARLCQRPAYRAHVMVPYDSLQVAGA